jgi:hypothetical protein
MRATMIGLALLGFGTALTAQAPAQAPAIPAPTPSAAQLALGRRMAEAGDFNAIVGAMGEAQLAQLAAAEPGLDEAGRDRLRVTGRRVLAAARARLVAQVGRIYASQFTLAQLRAITAFLEGPAGRAYTGAMPRLLPEIAATMQGLDFAAETRAAFCRETGRPCPSH